MLFKSTLLPLIFASAVSSLAIDGHSLEARNNDKYRDVELRAHAVVKGVNDIYVAFDFIGYLDGRPTEVQVNIKSGLTDSPEMGGPFAYHVHTHPVVNGDCLTALSHLDPYNVTESIVCDPEQPQFCQEGDFSGKHGKLIGTKSGSQPEFSFKDKYLRYFPEPASILGRSVVIHASNKTRIACGNIISNLDGTADKNWNPTNKPSNFTTHLPTAAGFNPPEIIQPFNGTSKPSKEFVDQLPFPLPFPAISLKRSVNIGFHTVTKHVLLKGKKTQVKLPKAFRVAGKGPFAKRWFGSYY